jgi:4-carboxymuconolactone decarboxylase
MNSAVFGNALLRWLDARMTSMPRPTAARITPKDADTEELREIFSRTITTPSGHPLNIFGTLAHHPKLLKRFNVLGGFFLNSGLLPARERELIILRVGWNCQSVYEFGQHTVIGMREGLTEIEVGALTRPVGEHNWSEGDASLLAAADDLCSYDCVSDATWARLTVRWSEAELMEIIMVAGMYRMVSGFLNSIGVELDSGIPGWPIFTSE